MTDAEASDYFFGLAWTWIGEHPVDALALFARKVYYVFNAAHVPLPHSYPFYAYDAQTALRFYVVGPWLLIPLGLAGSCSPISLRSASPRTHLRERLRRTRARTWSGPSFVPAYAAAVALFFVAERYRLPLLVPLCAGAGAAIDWAMDAARARGCTALAVAAGDVAVLGDRRELAART